MYVPGTVQADQEQMGSIFSVIGKAIGGVIKAGESALGLGPGGTKEVKVTVGGGGPARASIVDKNDPLAAAQKALEDATAAAGKVPTWVWVGGAALLGVVLVSTMTRGRRS